MADPEKKERLSAEYDRSGPSSPTMPVLPTVNPQVEKKIQESPANKIHPAFFVILWISLSSSVIIFNKWILDTAKFHYPITLTCWHLVFATLMTQVMARTTKLLDGRKTVKMTGRVYVRAIAPIGAAFSLSLICGNVTYLYLSVAFIQMLKACTPVAVLLAGWSIGIQKPDMRILLNVSVIVVGVIVASFGELQFVLVGVLFQIGGIIFEAIRLVMVDRLLNGAEYKMDPLVSLYYYAPICAVMNFCVALVFELPRIQLSEVYNVGLWILLSNALVAFALNVSVVFLIGRTSGLVMTLCGVLKDILLVGASVAIWGTPITLLQGFGYSIALCGLVYYKLGAATLKAQLSDVQRWWGEYGQRRPVMKKLIVFASSLCIIFIMVASIAPSVGYDTTYVTSVVKEHTKSKTPDQ
ncbi:uncharacterized protein KY384_007177 [Bacidia gigantensis]|uniref:uncharacterized protein n=1 Tax=Bacidia gigantensis TaxID=2732470 RepID=UPI001D050BB9|nr:uncharacterized protein KY384_007177 [Bacidia gigantensis]KAG8528260.1 hypothetical protein KY384_007177 [Bacidia gigantensis]